jgi:hypothetical protein
MSNPAMVVLGAGSLALAGEFAKEGGFPKDGPKAIIATVGLVIVFSVAANTPLEPLASALAWLILLGAVYAAVPAFQAGKKVAATKVKGSKTSG